VVVTPYPVHPYSNHPLADVIEDLGRRLYEAFDHACPGDRDQGWDELGYREKDLYMTVIQEVISFAPDAISKMLTHNGPIDGSAKISK
jgi:hypothetical protein